MKRRMFNSDGLIRHRAIIAVSFLVIVVGISPAMGMTLIPSNANVNLLVSNDAGARFNDFGNNTYHFFSPGQSASQGLNALHISTDPSVTAGQVTASSNQTGIFFLTDTGGRGWDDDGILILAVNRTIPDGFQVRIQASGYRWEPVMTGSYPTYENVTYYPVSLDETYTSADFLYGPQIWRPCPSPSYPVFDGQDMADANNTFSIMFIDLNAGILGATTLTQPSFTGQTILDNGAIRVSYSFTNLTTFAAFDAYAYTVSSNQGQGVRWTNRLSATGSSGYSVSGVPTAPTPIPIEGFTLLPTDPDSDGIYEDLNGNNDLDFNDVVVYFKKMEWILANEPVSLFDFNGNNDIDFNDVVRLFKEV